MSILRLIRENPIAILSLAVVGMIGWVVLDLATPAKLRDAKKIPQVADEEPAPLIGHIEIIGGLTAPAIPPAPGAPPSFVDVVARLRPGMTRIEVEGLLGAPMADRVHPVTAIDGRITYQTAYGDHDLAVADMPMTVRPIKRLPRAHLQSSDTIAASLIALEFDASKPGHPLVQVHFLDPLF